MLGTNRHDAVKLLEQYSESVGKCDNNQRKWCKIHQKMKETGKTRGKIDYKCKKTLKTHEEDVETAGKHDNDQRKSCKIQWSKNNRKMKETGKTFGKLE